MLSVAWQVRDGWETSGKEAVRYNLWYFIMAHRGNHGQFFKGEEFWYLSIVLRLLYCCTGAVTQ